MKIKKHKSVLHTFPENVQESFQAFETSDHDVRVDGYWIAMNTLASQGTKKALTQ